MKRFWLLSILFVLAFNYCIEGQEVIGNNEKAGYYKFITFDYKTLNEALTNSQNDLIKTIDINLIISFVQSVSKERKYIENEDSFVYWQVTFYILLKE